MPSIISPEDATHDSNCSRRSAPTTIHIHCWNIRYNSGDGVGQCNVDPLAVHLSVFCTSSWSGRLSQARNSTSSTPTSTYYIREYRQLPAAGYKHSMRAIAVLLAILAVASSASALTQGDAMPSLVGVNLTALPDNSLFTQWRPTSHFMAPHSWMNDPNGPSYDPASGLYHLFYQFNAGHVVWGNISWGHATSKDLVTWTDVTSWEGYDAVAIATGPPGSIDHGGIYTGTAQFLPITANQFWGLPLQCGATGDCDGQTIALVFYTAVDGSGTETQALAVSYDGRTFSKFENASINPVIRSPPPNLDVTGFRDPFYEAWPQMDSILGVDEPHFYVAIGSGINNVGPRVQFYTAPASNLTQWSYLGPLLSVALGSSWSETYSGGYGGNFECPGTFALTELTENGGDGVTAHYFVMMGSAVASTPEHPLSNWPLWTEIDVVRSSNGSAEGIIQSSGVIDWGRSYAWDSFYDAPNNRRIAFGWIQEGLDALRSQGWNGATTLPRELFVQVYSDLANTNNILSQNGSWTAVQNADGRWNMTTLAMRPAPDVVAALQRNATTVVVNDVIAFASDDSTPQYSSLNVTGDSIIIHAEIDIPSGANASVGFVLRRSPGGEEQTAVVYDPIKELLTINLTSSTQLDPSFVNTASHVAPLFLLDTYNSTDAASADTVREPLTLDIFLDNSVIEVFANSRVGIVGRTYPARNDSLGVGYVVSPGSGEFTLKQIQVWEGLERAWPERPANSSIQLV